MGSSVIKYSKSHHFWETSQSMTSPPESSQSIPVHSRPSGRKAAPLGIGGSRGNDALRQVLAGNTEDLPLSNGKGATTTSAARGWLMLGVLPCFSGKDVKKFWANTVKTMVIYCLHPKKDGFGFWMDLEKKDIVEASANGGSTMGFHRRCTTR